MPFPETKRIKFQNNPLIEVVCQLTFSDKLYSDDESFSDEALLLHNELKSLLPFFVKAKSISVEIESQQQIVNKTESEIFEFTSKDQASKIILTPDSIALVTNQYESWESFYGIIEFSLSKLEQYPVTQNLKRIGLRYKDVIEKSKVGLDSSCPWSELLNDKITCLMQDDVISRKISGLQSNFTIDLTDICKKSKMNANYGTVSNSETKEICFMIDCDFSVEGDINSDSTKEYLDAFNVKSRNFFQWCIKEKLYRALQPRDV